MRALLADLAEHGRKHDSRFGSERFGRAGSRGSDGERRQPTQEE
jgi:hypothetical protein